MMMGFRKTLLATACLLMLGGQAWAQSAAATYEPTPGQPGKDVIWLPTADAMVERMLDIAGLTPQDYLVDLGSGDGRTVIAAARRGARAHGIEYNPDLVAVSKRAAAAAGVASRATFAHGDIFESDFSSATVVTMFLLPELNVRLMPTILDMKPGTRIISNSFSMGAWEPDASTEVTGDCESFCNVLKWVVPAKVQGEWKLGDKDLEFSQDFQRLHGAVRERGGMTPITGARMDGARIRFTYNGQQYVGQVDGKTMRGTIDGGKAWTATRR